MMKDIRKNGESREVKLCVYDECKYTASKEVFENEKVITYSGCVGFEVVSGKDANDIESRTDGSCIDDYHEYLVVYFEDGSLSTFRNSYVDMFLF